MRKKRASGIMALLVLFIPLLLLVTGCPYDSTGTYGIKVAGDGEGGAIMVYEDKLGGSIYVQKINAAGEKMWGEKGVLLGETNSGFYSFNDIEVIHDSSGTIVAWYSYFPKDVSPLFHITKLNSAGNLLWQEDFYELKDLASDGSGGAIFVSNVSPLRIHRIDAGGNILWNPGGNRVGPTSMYAGVGEVATWELVSDGAGGAIVVWKESLYPPDKKPGTDKSIQFLFTQRLDSAGELHWGDKEWNGMLVREFPQDIWIDSLQVVEAGAGGVIITWFQVTEDPFAEPGHQQTWDIVVQRIDAGGNIQWRPDGITLEINKTDPYALPTKPSLVGDGSGGAIVIWRDTRRDAEGEASIYAQRIDTNGTQLWQAGGVKVSSTSLNPNPRIIGTALSEAIISYSFREDRKELRIQKLDSNGNNLWVKNGIPVTEEGFSSQSISPDGQGGAIVAWGVARKGLFSSEKAYVQRVSADGILVWGDKGIRLNP